MHSFLIELSWKKKIKRNILTFSLKAYFLLASSMALTKKNQRTEDIYHQKRLNT